MDNCPCEGGWRQAKEGITNLLLERLPALTSQEGRHGSKLSGSGLFALVAGLASEASGNGGG